MLTHDRKNVNFTWKATKCQFHAMHKLKNVDFRTKEIKMFISH